MPAPSTLLDTPADAAARLLALSLLEQLTQRAEGVSGIAASGDREGLDALLETLGRLRNCLKSYRAILRAAVRPGSRAELRQFAATARARSELARQLAWSLGQLDALAPRWRRGAERFVARLTRREAEAEAALRRAVREDLPSLHRRLAKQLAVYRAEVRLGDLPGARSFAAVTAERLAIEIAELRRYLAVTGSAAEAPVLRRVERLTARLRHLLLPAREFVDGSGPVIDRLSVIERDLAELGAAQALGGTLVRALETEGAARARRLGLLLLTGDARFDGLRAVVRDDDSRALAALIVPLRRELVAAGSALDAAWDADAASLVHDMTRLARRLADDDGAAHEDARSADVPNSPATASLASPAAARAAWTAPPVAGPHS